MSETDNRAPVVPAATLEVPQPACGRCQDWTTVVVMNTVFPCPACRPDDFQAWHATNGRVPGARAVA